MTAEIVGELCALRYIAKDVLTIFLNGNEPAMLRGIGQPFQVLQVFRLRLLNLRIQVLKLAGFHCLPVDLLRRSVLGDYIQECPDDLRVRIQKHFIDDIQPVAGDF